MNIVPWNALKDDATFYPYTLYTPPSLRYYNSFFSHGDYLDLSFAVMQKDVVQAICLVTASGHDSEKIKINAFGLPSTCWTVPNASMNKYSLEQACMKNFLKLIANYPGCEISYCDYDSKLSPTATALMEKGASVDLQFNAVIDLSLSVDELRCRLRSSYKSLINKAMKESEIRVLSSENCSWEDMLAFRELHIEEAGRETRSIQTWEKQYEQLCEGRAYIVFVCQAGVLIGASFFLHDIFSAYYGSGAYKRSLFPFPISHGSVWSGIVHAKSLGCKFFDIGRVYFPCSINESFSQKEQSISFFKKGFAETIQPRFELYIH